MNTAINSRVFESFPVLETDRLVLREFTLLDAQDLFEIRSNKSVMKYMDTDAHKSLLDAQKMIEGILYSFQNKEGINWAVIDKKTNQMIGYVGFWRLMKEHVRAEIGYALHPSFWSLGYMSEALKIVLEFGFSTFNLHSIEGNVNKNNKQSIELLEKFSFVKEAHFRENYFYDGGFIDSIIYSLLETDREEVLKN
ncbi:MAG: GNAT family N-acetyltransferase [Prolixibacteraceae bacterium]|jgi:ribosomal-protein-alanine N-acetyltransferase|nr:GNAT family N-acetyltransferase [Prolixibacteraceae bacterium]